MDDKYVPDFYSKHLNRRRYQTGSCISCNTGGNEAVRAPAPPAAADCPTPVASLELPPAGSDLGLRLAKPLITQGQEEGLPLRAPGKVTSRGEGWTQATPAVPVPILNRITCSSGATGRGGATLAIHTIQGPRETAHALLAQLCPPPLPAPPRAAGVLRARVPGLPPPLDGARDPTPASSWSSAKTSEGKSPLSLLFMSSNYSWNLPTGGGGGTGELGAHALNPSMTRAGRSLLGSD